MNRALYVSTLHLCNVSIRRERRQGVDLHALVIPNERVGLTLLTYAFYGPLFVMGLQSDISYF